MGTGTITGPELALSTLTNNSFKWFFCQGRAVSSLAWSDHTDYLGGSFFEVLSLYTSLLYTLCQLTTLFTLIIPSSQQHWGSASLGPLFLKHSLETLVAVVRAVTGLTLFVCYLSKFLSLSSSSPMPYKPSFLIFCLCFLISGRRSSLVSCLDVEALTVFISVQKHYGKLI